MRNELTIFEKNTALYDERNFAARIEAIEHIEFNIIDRIDGVLEKAPLPEELIALRQDAERVKRQLESVDDASFRRLRENIRMGRCTGPALKDHIDECVGCGPGGMRRNDEPGYDNLDAFISGLLLTEPPPAETMPREPEMVFYQPTPARIIFQFLEKALLTADDVLIDVGSGLGHVPIMGNLLSGAKATGIEFEPAYCDYARACAIDLNLKRVEFVNIDARAADYSGGTVFFMYTPFTGKLLEDVLEELRRESLRRQIRLFTYGPCTPEVCRHSWLTREDQDGDRIYTLGAFRSSGAL